MKIIGVRAKQVTKINPNTIEGSIFRDEEGRVPAPYRRALKKRAARQLRRNGRKSIVERWREFATHSHRWE